MGLDRPLNRYQVRLALARARSTPGIRTEHRAAIVRDAERYALRGLDKYPDDKFTYMSYADVGLAMADLTGDTSILDLAIDQMAAAVESDIPDPALRDALDATRRRRQRLAFAGAAAGVPDETEIDAFVE